MPTPGLIEYKYLQSSLLHSTPIVTNHSLKIAEILHMDCPSPRSKSEFSCSHGAVTKCVRNRQCILIMRRHKRRPPHQNSLRPMLCFYRSGTTKRVEEERHIALYQKTFAIALWAKSETTTSQYLSFSKSTYRSSDLPESLKTLATSSRTITIGLDDVLRCAAVWKRKTTQPLCMSCSSKKATL